jgi:hypothetical protein
VEQGFVDVRPCERGTPSRAQERRDTACLVSLDWSSYKTWSRGLLRGGHAEGGRSQGPRNCAILLSAELEAGPSLKTRLRD